MNCFYCEKEIDLAKDEYFRSVTHGIYMHLPCLREYEKRLQQGEFKLYVRPSDGFTKKGLSPLPDHR